ncbi:ammonium transporter [Bernardetia sp.]|uniref:ammonium transporter n=1 Tax=Bernardetia sp. TaxID=1937974 RepID=UPI0025BA6DF2|nr:ammonium transporter [Bernardetia sp.]
MTSIIKKVSFSVLLVLLPLFASAQDIEKGSTLNTGDTAWVLIATALVMLMTPAGLALFYGGLSHSKNTLNTVGMSYVSFCVASVAWVVVGYSLAFSEGNAFIGSLNNLFLGNVGIEEIAADTSIPKLLFVVFQGTFAAIAVAIVSGSVVERVKFSFWLVFSFLWVLLVYSPITHWVWGGGFLSNSGELDFAGGTVIHINAGVAGLVLALLLGKRKDFGKATEMPISLTLTVVGSALLWFGWFGFNAGSALSANGTAANALLVTNVAASIGGLSWIAIEAFNKKKPSLLGVASGAVSGLVGITPACGYVNVGGALMIGLISGIIGYYGVVKLKHLLNYDDTLDAFGIHGLVGIWGSIATGIFANPSINTGSIGALYGNMQQIGVQLLAVLMVIAYSAIATTVVYFVSSFVTKGARVDETMEATGLDEAYHGERGFNIQ